jgi:hypothetical protein
LNLIPLESYETVYYNILLVFVFICLFQAQGISLESASNLKSKKAFGFIILIFVLMYMGWRPVSFIFGDMGVYAVDYEKYRNGMSLSVNRDILFELFMRTCSQLIPVEMFFFLCCCIYVMPLYAFSKKIFKDYWFYSFFILVLSFSFWAYGTNGIRNGIATSLFLYAVSKNNKVWIGVWMFIAFSIHQSVMIPIFAYVIAMFYKNTKVMMFGWLLAIPLSFALGSFWENFFLHLGVVQEDRIIGYLSGSEEYLDQIVEVKTGFRWDFILYSATGVFAGWYFVVKRGFSDKYYNHLFSVYLMSNAVWILIIRSNFSNRIAYLSWFLLGVIIIYPLLKNRIFTHQHKIIGGVLVLYSFFTYFLNVILTK